MTDSRTLGQSVPKEGLFLMDGIEGLRSLPKHSVDMLLTDPPYGTTRNYWDVPLPLPELWEAVKWAVKPNGAVLFFAQCPFDKVLGASNLAMLRYEWIWYKERGTGFLNANRAPLKKSENILVFYQKSPVYNPQFTYGKPYARVHSRSGTSSNYGKFERQGSESNDGRRYPGNVLFVPTVSGGIHPTQKPVELCEYLIRTYTRPGELVADICVGSGTTAIAAINTERRFVCSPSYTVRRWRLGAYIRLSKEDLKKGKDDSNSVINQRDLLNDFYQKHIGEFESVSEYVDDGHTGTDANRENFQRLLSDVMSGKINCVVVKDLSRFARNYSDAGSLIDNLFVQMGVRFISLAENVDSYLNPDSVSSIIVPITNVMNDQYCYQTSKKIRQVFDYKRRNGQYIGAFAPYGYVKHPKDKHRLIIDPDAAEIVKLIFSLFLKGTSKRAIALYLNEHGVPSPSAYKLQKGIPVSTRGYDDPMWGARMIHSILTNPTYTGDLAQGRSRVKSYKVHEVESVPREEWVEVAGTHEAIIDYETFDKVQALLQRDTRTSPKGREVHLFSGFLKCADCGRAITRSVGNNNNVYYACSTYKNRSRTACTMHSIKHNRLEAAVLFAVQQQVHLAVSYSEMIARINTAPVKKSQSIRLEELIAAKERELAKISRYKQSLYQDWKDGEITQQDYRDMKADYERQTIALTDVLARLNAERAELANGVKSEHPALVAFTKHQNIDQLSRELLVELIDHIKVYENGNISVRFKFADEFRRIAEYIEINTTKPAVAG